MSDHVVGFDIRGRGEMPYEIESTNSSSFETGKLSKRSYIGLLLSHYSSIALLESCGGSRILMYS